MALGRSGERRPRFAQEGMLAHDGRLNAFWLIHLVMLGLFGLELAFVLSVWLKARVPGLPPSASRWRKLAVTARFAVALLFSRRVWPLLKALLADGMIHRRLYRTSSRRWLAHIAVFGSWLVLGVLSTMTGVVVEILPLLGMSPARVAALPILGQLYHADVWWVALLNEVLGLVVLVGMAWVLYRRYVQRDPQLRTIPADSVVIALLTLIALGGFPVETFRLLSAYTTSAGLFAPDPGMIPVDKLPLTLYGVWGPQWGFVGYLSAQGLGALRLEPGVWAFLHNLFFWGHVAVVTALLFLLPFTRFFHVIMSPVIVAYNTMLDADQLPPGERGLAWPARSRVERS